MLAYILNNANSSNNNSSNMALDDFFIDPAELPEGIYGAVQLAFLLVVYGYILFTASNLISDGSELLLLVPSLAGLVGSVVLPVLGAVPDGAIVLFSGLGDDAQTQLSVGVGALADMFRKITNCRGASYHNTRLFANRRSGATTCMQ
eukprot:15785-Heterococcus_DN1.PRE.6